MSSLPNIVVGRCCGDQPRDLLDLVGLDQHARLAGGERGQSVWLKPNTPHSGRMESDSVSGAVEAEGARHLLGVARDRALAMQHELGRAGRARGREDVARRVGRGVVGGERAGATAGASNGTRRRRSMAGGTGAGVLADDDDGAQSQSSACGLDAGQDRQEVDAPEARRAGQHLGARTADDVGDLDRAIARVHRDGDGAEPRAGEIEDRIGRHVGQPQRHAIARPDAEIG